MTGNAVFMAPATSDSLAERYGPAHFRFRADQYLNPETNDFFYLETVDYAKTQAASRVVVVKKGSAGLEQLAQNLKFTKFDPRVADAPVPFPFRIRDGVFESLTKSWPCRHGSRYFHVWKFV